MLKKTIQIIMVIFLTVVFNGCQSFDFKQGWDSVKVSDTPLFKVYQRGPLVKREIYLPANDYWYKYYDNYEPKK